MKRFKLPAYEVKVGDFLYFKDQKRKLVLVMEIESLEEAGLPFFSFKITPSCDGVWATGTIKNPADQKVTLYRKIPREVVPPAPVVYTTVVYTSKPAPIPLSRYAGEDAIRPTFKRMSQEEWDVYERPFWPDLHAPFMDYAISTGRRLDMLPQSEDDEIVEEVQF